MADDEKKTFLVVLFGENLSVDRGIPVSVRDWAVQVCKRKHPHLIKSIKIICAWFMVENAAATIQPLDQTRLRKWL